MKKVTLTLLLLIFAGLAWYLFIKKYDYQFETTARYGPGAVSYELSEWKKLNLTENSADIELINKEDFKTLTQRIKVDSFHSLEFNWELEKLNDSATSITLNVYSKKNKLGNRIDIVNPFQTSNYIDSLKEKVINFKKQLRDHQNLYRITPETSLVNTPGMECICSSSKGIPLTGKASEMMRTISVLENYVLKNEISLNGYPFLKVTNWNREQDLIAFDFCFPVKDISNLQETAKISLKKFSSQKALKLLFNGNYRLSHISWFDLIFMAQDRGMEIEEWPMEIYHDNPKIDSDHLNWKAEVYLPVSE
ncbi:hypothetical protein ML462_06700 [Gramella lutea]|uniref:Effector-binding domain-containing protein n=1 Tax=Christiangramia lutea TaxID=1607951 RepID=A0A9X1V261_9FLAO|nr:hypothetical protein [Christiangramia lutea]MCH4822858.1 hypothetical protein [Christiangramia lutea]